MKKTLPSVALLLAAVGSWAFYPKTAEPSTASMMLISRSIGTSFSNQTITLTTIEPGKEPQKWETTTKLPTSLDKQLTALDLQRTAEANKLHELRQAGWHLVHAGLTGGPNTFGEMIYVLEK